MGLNILLYLAMRDFSSQKRLQRYSVKEFLLVMNEAGGVMLQM